MIVLGRSCKSSRRKREKADVDSRGDPGSLILVLRLLGMLTAFPPLQDLLLPGVDHLEHPVLLLCFQPVLLSQSVQHHEQLVHISQVGQL